MQRVQIDRADNVAIVRLNRPEVLNAIDQALWVDLIAAFRDLADDDGVRACILTGNGRGFCSGADLRETAWHGESQEQSRQRLDSTNQEAARRIIALPVPVIACVNGPAIGGGAEIALAADMRLASHDALFGFPEAAIGRFISGGASLLLQRAVGLSWAKRLLYTCERIDADKALAIGLVDEVTTADQLLERGLELARQIAACRPPSIVALKRTLDRIAFAQLEEALALETDALAASYLDTAIDDASSAFVNRDRSST